MVGAVSFWDLKVVHDEVTEEAGEAAELIARDGKRASDVISRIRALVRKTGSEKAQLNINQAIEEVVHLTEDEALRKGVVLRTELADDLPFVLGDRVQLQQVLLNLIIQWRGSHVIGGRWTARVAGLFAPP